MELLRYVIIGSAGGNGLTSASAGTSAAYASLAAAEAAERFILSGSGNNIRFLVSGSSTADTTPVTFDQANWGPGTSAEYITVEAIQNHGGVWNANQYRLVTDDFFASFTINVSYFRLIGLQSENSRATASGGRAAAFRISDGDGDQRAIRCIARKTNGAIANSECAGFSFIGDNNNKRIEVVDCLAYDFNTNFSISNIVGTSGHNIVLYNNTSIDATNRGLSLLMYGTSDSWYIVNNLMQGSNTNYYTESTPSTSTILTNLTEDSTSPNAHLANKSLTFVNRSADNFNLSATDTSAIGQGTDLSSDPIYPFTYDIANVTRSSPWDIGAFEYVSSNTNISVSVDILSASYSLSSPNINTDSSVSVDILSASYSLSSPNINTDSSVSVDVLSGTYLISNIQINSDVVLNLDIVSASYSILDPSIQIPISSNESLLFSAVDSRAVNTSSTAFDVPTISFLFWVYPTAYDFGTIFGADENNNAIWIHMDSGNTGIAFRYLRETQRGHWVIGSGNPITLNNWYCVALSYERTDVSADPTFYLRRLGSQSAMSYEPSLELFDPQGAANTPSPGYHLGATPAPFFEFPFYGAIYGFQAWNRIVTSAEFEQASLNPGSVTNGLILNLNYSGVDLSLSAGSASLANVGVSANPPGIPTSAAPNVTVFADLLSGLYSLFDASATTNASVSVDLLSASYLILSASTGINFTYNSELLSASYSLSSPSVQAGSDASVSVDLLSASYSVPYYIVNAIVEYTDLNVTSRISVVGSPGFNNSEFVDDVTVSVGLLSASYSALSNSVYVDNVISVDILSASYSILDASTGINFTYNSELLSASYSLSSPNINTDSSVSVDILSASYSLLSPSVQAGSGTSVSVDILSGTDVLFDVSLYTDSIFSVDLLSASHSFLTPNVEFGDGITVNVDVLSGSYDLSTSQIGTGLDISLQEFSATYSLLEPSILTGVVISVPTLSSSYGLQTPSINTDCVVAVGSLMLSMSIFTPTYGSGLIIKRRRMEGY